MSTYPSDPAQPANHANHADRPVTVTLLVRSTCGSCARVREQITPLCVDLHADLDVVDVDGETSLAVEFGDRVPVVLVDDEEVACWEIDDDELVDAVTAARAR
ncbi:hypothetical protein CVAR_2741 [Corynebacterium variabile DSM 44702]|uniref:Glutaredoxin-like domain (DUF836) n=2 Tax=Corynebacterium variabile TaxID=1727 RepID=A0A0X2NQM4_9CORY|nr:hypothetical protein CVAR_2741 [Corynebacterium variabile DSM 44702]CUU67169.1 Glutaredoxin-like domain (DUF836) [Corynebacterium variabile]